MSGWRADAAWLLVAFAALTFGVGVGPHLYDAGELTAAAVLLGASHPPGQPLHALLGHLACLLPLGDLPFRVALLSLVGELGAAYLVMRLTKRGLEGMPPSWPVRLAPHSAAVCALLAPPLLRQATRVEVYGLALALSLWAVAEALEGLRYVPGALGRASLLAGLAAALHPPHIVAPAVMVAVVLLHDGRQRVRPRTVALCAVMLLAGLASYAYLPLRSLAGAPMWGDAHEAAGFWAYVSGAAYRHNLADGAGSTLANLGPVALYVALATSVLPAMGLIAALFPSGEGPSRSRALRAMALAFPFTLFAAVLQPLEESNPDNVAYAAPALALLVAAGTAGLVRALVKRSALALVTLGLVGLNPFEIGLSPERADASLPALETLAGVLVDAPPTRALIVVETDFTAAAIMMAQAVDGARPDVALLVTGLATSSWHYRWLSRHPAFDGRPMRGHGRDAREMYVNGAIRHALTAVPVVSEPDWPLSGGRGRPLGPYLALPPRLEPPTYSRQLAYVAAEGAARPLGDDDAAGAVLRAAITLRARRAGHRVDEALAWMVPLLWFLPDAQRALLDAPVGRMDAPPARWVVVPSAFMVPPEDAVRLAAVLLDAGGAAEPARALLMGQLERGDPRSLLQTAALEARAGRAIAAHEVAQRAVAIDPALAAEAEAFRPRGQ